MNKSEGMEIPGEAVTQIRKNTVLWLVARYTSAGKNSEANPTIK
jgi:hypothetical protein